MIVLDRRRFVSVAFHSVAALLAFPLRARSEGSSSSGLLSKAHIDALTSSRFVYVSPLKRDGSESSCHAEVWYAWLDGRVVMTVSSDGWKSKSIDRGLEGARVWVGDYGPVNRQSSSGQGFRQGPSFRARAQKLQDPELLERLLREYARKYPDEIGKWRDRMRTGHAEGSRVLIRYRPEAD